MHAGPVNSAEFNPLRPNLMATGGGADVNILDIQDPVNPNMSARAGGPPCAGDRLPKSVVHAGPVLMAEFHPLRPNLIATGGFGEVNIIDISVPPRSFAATMSDMLTFYLSSMHHLASRVPQFLAT